MADIAVPEIVAERGGPAPGVGQRAVWAFVRQRPERQVGHGHNLQHAQHILDGTRVATLEQRDDVLERGPRPRPDEPLAGELHR